MFDDGLTESVGDATVILAPATLSLLGVRPQQVTEKTVLGNFCGPSDLLQLCHGDKLRRETAVHAEDLVVDEGRDGHAVEDILELLPDANGISALAFIIESVNTIDLATFVIASQKEEVLLELGLVGKKQDNSLEGVLSSVNVITEEQIVGLGREAAVLKESEQV